MNIHVETDRFILRDIEESDVQGIFDLDSDPEVHTYLGTPPIKTLDEARDVISYIRNQYTDNGIGRWAVIDRNSGDFVGWTGLKYEQELRTEFDYYDIGYRLRRKYWGQGIATLTAIESVRYGFEHMDLDEICGAADVDHKVSNHILQKIGLSYVEQFVFEGTRANFYRIKKSEWSKKQTSNQV
jgi:ribosomal-protein-alanine N-acetyltransferase